MSEDKTETEIEDSDELKKDCDALLKFMDEFCTKHINLLNDDKIIVQNKLNDVNIKIKKYAKDKKTKYDFDTYLTLGQIYATIMKAINDEIGTFTIIQILHQQMAMKLS